MRILLEGFLAGFGPGVLRTPGQGQVAALRAHSYRLAKHPLLAAYPSRPHSISHITRWTPHTPCLLMGEGKRKCRVCDHRLWSPHQEGTEWDLNPNPAFSLTEVQYVW